MENFLRLISYRVLYLLIFYCLLGFYFGRDFSSYNFVYITIGFLFLFFNKGTLALLLKYKELNIIFFILFSFTTILLVTQKNALYFILDFLNFALIAFLIFNSKIIIRDEKLFNYFFRFSIAYVTFYFFVFFFFGSSYIDTEEGRYAGLFGSTNMSSSFICILICYIYEYAKFLGKKKNLYILLCIGLSVLLVIVTKSRTLFFIVPYWLWQIYLVLGLKRSTSKKVIFLLLSVLITIISFNLFEFYSAFAESFRLKADGSFLTRDYIYSLLWQRVKDSYYILPNGFNDANLFIQEAFMTKLAVHNDFLRYWNDLGVFFILFVIYILKEYKDNFKNVTFITVMLFVGTFALHNILFSIIMWFALYFLLKLINLNFISR